MRDYRVPYTTRYRTYTIDCHVVKMAKQVLVRVGENSRPVTIEPGDLSSSDVERLKQSIYKCFDDVLKVDASESILLQILLCIILLLCIIMTIILLYFTW